MKTASAQPASGHDTETVEGADILLQVCGRLRAAERAVIVCDASTRELGELLAARARRLTDGVELLDAPPAGMHGEEPPQEVAEAMRRADLCLGIRAKSMAHTQARLAAAAAGARYLSLPDYSLALLRDRSLRADYEARGRLARGIAEIFTRGTTATVTSAAGTRVTMGIEGRTGNGCPGYVAQPGELGSPPDIEANVSPIETSGEGLVVVDGSIPYPGLGLLNEPVILTVAGGRIINMDGPAKIVETLKRLFASAGSWKASVLAECGVGLNDRAALTGVMLTDEGAAGTMHFGFGSNATVGGKNDVPFHLDFVFRSPSLEVDGTAALRDGALTGALAGAARTGERS